MAVKTDVDALLKWRKTALRELARIPDLERTVAVLFQRLTALERGQQVATDAVGPMPKKESRLPFEAVFQDIEDRFERLFRAADQDDEDAEEWSASALAKRMNVTYSAALLGRALNMLDVFQVRRRRDGKVVRLYRVVLAPKNDLLATRKRVVTV